MTTVLFAGFGDLGRNAGVLLAKSGLRVVALKRTVDETSPEMQMHSVDLRKPFTLPTLAEQPEAVVIAVSPQQHDPGEYKAIYVGAVQYTLEALQAARVNPKMVLFVSSTVVWPEHSDQWITEITPAKPDSWRGEIMVRAEQTLFSGPYKGVSLRLGGLYGPGRYMLLRKADAILAGRDVMPAPAWTNRIHRDDAAQIIAFLINRVLSGVELDSIYNGVDNEPSLNTDTLRFMIESLQEPGSSELQLPVNNQGVVQGKRIDNSRIRSHGFEFRFPNFRVGYADIIKQYRAERTIVAK